MSFLSCNNQQREARKTYTDNIPEVDSNTYTQCYTRYKTQLYDNKYLLEFNVKIVYVVNSYMDKIFAANKDRDSTIINNLNNSFSKEGITFLLRESVVTPSKEFTINSFYDNGKSYSTNERLVIVVYENTGRDAFYGGALGIPSTTLAILSSKINTSTLPHEMGHLLGLKHVFEKDDTDGLNSRTGDEICDTGSFNLMDNRTINCSYAGDTKYTEKDLEILIPNYLNYNYEEVDCRDRFTPIQNLAMRWYIENFPQLYSTLVY